METYTAMRHFADSWGALAMMIFFVAAVVWVFRPAARKGARDAAEIPFKDYTDKDA